MGAISKEEYLKALSVVLEYQKHIKCEFEEVEKNKIITPDMKLQDVDIISIRLHNCLRSFSALYNSENEYYRDAKVENLKNISLSKFKYHRNVGPNTINNLLEVCALSGVKLKP
jgi:DNA helicase TIP49 (TBP-interacting protein)